MMTAIRFVPIAVEGGRVIETRGENRPRVTHLILMC